MDANSSSRLSTLDLSRSHALKDLLDQQTPLIMTSHFIDRFAKRAAHLEPSTSSSRSSHQSAAPRPAGGLDKRAEVERAELSGVREEGCTFCNIVAREEPAFTVCYPAKVERVSD